MTNEDTFFLQATKDVNELSSKPDNDTLLKLYGYYKQATLGNNTTEKPSFLDFKGNAKWNAWTKRNSMSKLTAKVKYIKLVKQLQEK
jgi:diazepam-binding inhibitor (GABA receptor modulating acyl-CoA-binding protein)